ncbi:hypothetical protein V8F06_013169 [Rhypophila decipiens]
MGGSAFAAYGLRTPRMPPNVYKHVKKCCLDKLSELYVITASPIEAPEKEDFGDVDVLVAVERPPAGTRVNENPPSHGSGQNTHNQLLTIGQKLQASHSIILSPPVSANFAIPWPAGLEGNAEQQHAERFIQVDVRICRTEQQLKWALFKHAHGDIWNMIGSMIRPYGLTADEQALWLRIPEIEKHDRKQAKVKLTDDPAEVIDFLGMKSDGFWTEPFESVAALYQYVTTCRLPLIRWPSSSSPPGAAAAEESPANGSTTGTVDDAAEVKKSLKSNDRRRMNQRPIYRTWINEIVPKLMADDSVFCADPDTDLPRMRAQVEEQALERFSGAKQDYESRLRAWRLVKNTEAVKRMLKELVPPHDNIHYRSTLVSALKKIILDGDQSFKVYPDTPFKTEDGFYDLDAVRTFFAEKGDELGAVAWQRQCKKGREALEVKLARQRAQQAVTEKLIREELSSKEGS